MIDMYLYIYHSIIAQETVQCAFPQKHLMLRTWSRCSHKTILERTVQTSVKDKLYWTRLGMSAWDRQSSVPPNKEPGSGKGSKAVVTFDRSGRLFR